MMKKLGSLFALAMVIATVGQAQQSELNLYHLYKTVPQANSLNAALFPDYKITVAMPGFGGHLAYVNNNFLTLNYIRKNTDATGTLNLSASDFSDELRSVNRLEVGTNSNIFHVGMRFPTTYVSVGANLRTTAGISMPREFLELILLGNGHPDVAESNIDLRKFSLRNMMYAEAYVTVGKEITTDLYVGGRIKYLNGLTHFGLDRIGADFTVNSEEATMQVEEFTLRSGGIAGLALKSVIDSTNNSPIGDINPQLLFSNFRNSGLAFDVGGRYQWGDFMFHGGLNDLGFIRWNPNSTLQLQFRDAEFSYDGIDLARYITNPDQAQNDFNSLGDNIDSLVEVYSPEIIQNQGYSTALTGRFYLGAYYDLGSFHRVGVLSYNTLVNRRLFPALNFSYNIKVRKIVNFAVSTSLVGGKFNNLGTGASVNLGLFNLYMSTDNVLAFMTPAAAQNVNARVGINFNFGTVGGKRVRLRRDKQAVDNGGEEGTLDFLDEDGGRR